MAFNLDNIITHDFCNINKYINKLFFEPDIEPNTDKQDKTY